MSEEDKNAIDMVGAICYFLCSTFTVFCCTSPENVIDSFKISNFFEFFVLTNFVSSVRVLGSTILEKMLSDFKNVNTKEK